MADAPNLPNVSVSDLAVRSVEKLIPPVESDHPPRILLLYGSRHATSYSRLLVLEAERLLQHFGAETRIFASWPAMVDSKIVLPFRHSNTLVF